MKILFINGSPHETGHCKRAISIMSEVFSEQNIATHEYSVSHFLPNGCRACGGCRSGGGCILGDLGEVSEAFLKSDGIVVAAPVYYGSPTGSVISFLDRLFQSAKFDKRMKVGAAFVTARRGGCTASFDVLNKYFSISEMPIATSSYWNMMHTAGDSEGEATARTLALNMAALIKYISRGREAE